MLCNATRDLHIHHYCSSLSKKQLSICFHCIPFTKPHQHIVSQGYVLNCSVSFRFAILSRARWKLHQTTKFIGSQRMNLIGKLNEYDYSTLLFAKKLITKFYMYRVIFCFQFCLQVLFLAVYSFFGLVHVQDRFQTQDDHHQVT